MIAANRAQLASLVATNLLGQNTPAIAATEVHYAEMWAQDAAAMYGYAGSSAAATQVPPFTPRRQRTPMRVCWRASRARSRRPLPPWRHGQPVAVSAGHCRAKHVAGIGVPRVVDGVFGDVIDLGAGRHLEPADGGSSGNSALDNFWSEWGPDANIWNTIFRRRSFTRRATTDVSLH